MNKRNHFVVVLTALCSSCVSASPVHQAKNDDLSLYYSIGKCDVIELARQARAIFFEKTPQKDIKEYQLTFVEDDEGSGLVFFFFKPLKENTDGTFTAYFGGGTPEITFDSETCKITDFHYSR